MVARRFDMSFKDKYKVNDAGCWIWQAAKDRDGYGMVRYKNLMLRAHRLSYELHKGEIPEGHYVRHTCDTPSCVNPQCLIVGTEQDNSDDMVARGRSLKGTKHHKAVLHENDVSLIKSFLKRHPICGNHGGQQNFLARWFGVTRHAIRHIRDGSNWSHL